MSKVIATICSHAPAPAAADGASEAAASEALDPESPVARAQRGREHKQAAFLSKGAQEAGQGRRGYWSMIWREVAYRGGMQLLFFVLLFFVLWFRGALPPHIQSRIDWMTALVWRQQAAKAGPAADASNEL